MSLNRYGEDGQIETSQNSPQPKAKSPKTQRPFSREGHQIIQEILDNRQKGEGSLQEQAPAEYEQEIIPAPAQTLPQGIGNIKARVHQLLDQSGANTQNAKVDERVLLMASAVLEMCDLLKIYSENMNSEMERLNANALQTLNLQEQYAKSVKSTVVQTVYDIHTQVKKQQEEGVNELMQYVQTNSKSMEVDITSCADKVKSATDAATTASEEISGSIERFRKVKTFWNFLYCTAPIYVVLDIILKIITFFMQR